MKHDWTPKELNYLNQYLNLVNEYVPEEPGPDQERESQLTMLEGALLITKKYLIAYHERIILGIFTFREICDLMDLYNQQGKIITFHPLNYKNTRGYVETLIPGE